jgi:hypothetical protein
MQGAVICAESDKLAWLELAVKGTPNDWRNRDGTISRRVAGRS